ncbi:MAG: SUMF1/EgtB/PvdO family nonheme iron enzyme [Capsulimonadaceae bacterium]
MPDTRQSTKTTVFVSYAREDALHSRRVLQLADRLVRDGLNVILDQYEPRPKTPWTVWMEDNLDTADCVLMVCSPAYHRRVEEREPAGDDLGVQWDGKLIYSRLYENVEQASKFIPVLLPECSEQDIPLAMRNAPRYVLAAFNLTDPGYEGLYRYLMLNYHAMKPVVSSRAPVDDSDVVRPSQPMRYSRRLGTQVHEPEPPAAPSPTRRESGLEQPGAARVASNSAQPGAAGITSNSKAPAVPSALDSHGPVTESARLVATISDPTASLLDRAADGRRLATIGDPRPGVGLRADGLPDISWCRIPPEVVYVRGERKEQAAFRIARYPVTFLQFQAFVDAADGFKNSAWWDVLHQEARKQQQKGPGEPHSRYTNHPRDCVSWYDAMAFCRWLSLRLRTTVTLPTEQQWERAARGSDGRVYPYGDEFDASKGNTFETGLRQSSAVGAFPAGASPYGVMDMSGNVREWTLAEIESAPEGHESSAIRRVVRGGSWRLHEGHARIAHRQYLNSSERIIDVGFRLASPGDAG